MFVLVLFENMYQTLESMFDHISKHLEVCDIKNTALCFIFLTHCLEIRSQSFMFDILPYYIQN